MAPAAAMGRICSRLPGLRRSSVVPHPYKAPSVNEKDFNCPHCGALAKQFWHDIYAHKLDDDRTPIRFTPEDVEVFSKNIENDDARDGFRSWAERLARKLPFLAENTSHQYSYDVNNLSLSKCYNCGDISIWIADRLAYPQATAVPAPNADLPDEAKRDYREAASIVDLSPRGAAALLRLAIQKVALSLGGEGKNLNDDIATLVEKGLDRRVQQALDVVRVVGNNAVHPGELDIRDDTSAAHKLFELVNLIADIMISQPKHIAALYGELPEGARVAVARRDKAEVSTD